MGFSKYMEVDNGRVNGGLPSDKMGQGCEGVFVADGSYAVVLMGVWRSKVTVGH